MKKYIWLILILTGIIFFGCKEEKMIEYNLKNPISSLTIPASPSDSLSPTISDSPAPKGEEKPKEEPKTIEIATQIAISVPFADQAPHKNWGEPYQEACEETAIIMAHEFVAGNDNSDLDKGYINQQILDMVSWQEKNWGGHFDLDIQMTLDLFQKYYNYNGGEIVSINSPDDLKKILSSRNIIIAPTYGRNLANPYFTAPGPVYHMLVIKGYDESNFITNDPGVWQGKDFIYPFDNLFESIHDLPAEAAGKKGYIKANPDLIVNGEKNVILISR